ncbi:MAG: winged helix-turn-helix domain-containing protein [Thermoanaerobaculales bacterium]|jgi:DNA-binding winged helix-turn-helix (wHTH) protein/WD40 repeat protein|nr:winged helix-turn-helix domain-containing protein [Thermoanaerobaculales bacterium]
MAPKTEICGVDEVRFRVGDWFVDPSLNRATSGGETVQLAHKAMNVLLCLAARAGEVVSKNELTDAVWQTEFVSENTLTRRIAELRDALGDDARNPRYIETIPKHGYRLIAEVAPDGDHGPAAEPALQVRPAAQGSPYPGLAPFTEADADRFFGRDSEIASLWRRITGRRLLAVIGPSGAGKSSLLRAGVVARAPPGWRAVACHPGDEPLLALARALAPDLAGDTEETRQLLAFHDLDVALAVSARWRGRFDEALVVVDQFEELFTLNSQKVQQRFVDLLRRLVDAAGIHVVLVLRDDFLLECHRFPRLAPIFSELTPVGPPTSSGLRQAITEPAAGRLVTLESQTLVDEMIAEVEDERGALPLLAFAMSRLWELRDRERRMLTRSAYESIGGVGGALAQHAEATLEAIGYQRLPIVRELFRNLVTAQGTRAVREVDDLLSVFEGGGVRKSEGEKVRRSARPSAARKKLGVRSKELRGTSAASDSEQNERSPFTATEGSGLTLHSSPSHSSPARAAASEVLDVLIDARLLTSFDKKTTGNDGESPRRRVEIVHESLLRAWPRLVGWQTQDADAAQLRDQLRQAARIWDTQGRSDDLLWSGAAYRRFQVWRESYPGGLSSTEEAFASAMTRHAARRQRRRRLVVGFILLAVAAVAAVTTALWRRSELRSRQLEARRLCELADREMASCPAQALAHAQASLELLDTPDGRRLANEALWRSPMPVYLTPANHPGPDEIATINVDFSPDGRWLVANGNANGLVLWPRSGGAPSSWQTGQMWGGLFLPNSSLVTTDTFDGKPIVVWSVPDGRRLGTMRPKPSRQDGTRDTFPDAREGNNLVRLWRPVPDPAADVGWRYDDRVFDLARRLPGEQFPPAAVGPRGERLLAAVGDVLELYSLDEPDAPPLRIVPLPVPVEHVAWQPGGERAATIDIEGAIQLWSLAADEPELLRRWPGDGDRVVCSTLLVNPTGDAVAAVRDDGTVILRTVHDPPGADPLRLLSGGWRGIRADFSTDGRWLAVSDFGGGSLWPVARWRYPHVLRGHTGAVPRLEFTPDGGRLVSISLDGTVRQWPLHHDERRQPGVLFDWGHPVQQALAELDVSPDGAFVVATGGERSIRVVPLDGSPPRPLGFFDQRPWVVAVGPEGRKVAACGLDGTVVWDLESGESTEVDLIKCRALTFTFSLDGRLLVSGENLDALDPVTGELTRLFEGVGFSFALSRDEKLVLSNAGGGTLHDLDRGVSTRLVGHGALIGGFDPTGTVAITFEGETIFVGPPTGGAVHRLIARSPVTAVAVSPDGRTIASGHDDGAIRLWPMPDVSRPTLYDLPHDELLAVLKTRLDVAPNHLEPGGAPLRKGPFPGWATEPEW